MEGAERPVWAPDEVDLTKPSVARVYDYYLGGSHNFAVDRAFAATVLEAMPDLPRHAQENRAFLRRAVRALVAEGIDQFVDLGSGIPTVGNVHEVAQALNPDARIAYVDWDPVALAHSRAILAGNPNATVVAGDLRKPAELLAEPALAAAVDLARPFAILLVSVLHFVPDDDKPEEIVATLADSAPPGSYLVISHASNDRSGQPDQAGKAEALYNRTTSPFRMRDRTEIAALFGGLELVEPGVVQMPLWRPDSPEDVAPDATTYPGFAGVARIS
ncbi:SAM-dependent methyltransferase [Catenuloplanes sp. NPDC051500]|uniref:SAM-dependent methyltransferase n=1 Tax=Catenuloplanes sp. NPDC051500 TaxID=3363959 RepID=UPI0037A42DE8